MVAVEGRGGREVRGDAGAGRKREGRVAAKIEDEAGVVRHARIGYGDTVGVGDDDAELDRQAVEDQRIVQHAARDILPACAAIDRDLLVDGDAGRDAGVVGLIVGRDGDVVDAVAGGAGDGRGVEMVTVEGRGGRQVRCDAGAGRKREGRVAAEIEDEAGVVRHARIGYGDTV